MQRSRALPVAILFHPWRRMAASQRIGELRPRAAGADLLLPLWRFVSLPPVIALFARRAAAVDRRHLPIADTDAAIAWLIAQRLLLGVDDLRCPHQRLASVLLGRIIEGQSTEGRQAIACMLKTVLADNRMPLGGLGVLLSELSTAGEYRQWSRLVQQPWLSPVLLTRAVGQRLSH